MLHVFVLLWLASARKGVLAMHLSKRPCHMPHAKESNSLAFACVALMPMLLLPLLLLMLLTAQWQDIKY